MSTPRFIVATVDENTYTVIDNNFKAELCVCNTYAGQMATSFERANMIADASNRLENSLKWERPS